MDRPDMDFLYLSSPPWLPALLLLPCLISFLFFMKNLKKQPNLPPGPPRLPITGNLHQLGKLPYRSLAKLSKDYGPIMLLKLGQVATLVVSSPEMAKQVLKTHDLDCCSRPFSHGPNRLSYNFLDIGFVPYNNYWRDIRKLCVVELFSPNRVQFFAPIRAQETAKLINSLSLGSPNPIEIGEKIFRLSRNIICKIAFGKSFEGKQFESGKFQDTINEAMAMLSGYWGRDFFPYFGWIIDVFTGRHSRLEKCFNDFDVFYEKVLEEHMDPNRPQPEQEDIIDIMLRQTKDENPSFGLTLTKDHIKAVLMGMAGESDKAKDITERSVVPATEAKESGTVAKKKQRGVISRIWNGLFRLHGDDFEKRLQHISKEEGAILARMRKRSQSWSRMARNLIIFSSILEVVAVGYAIMTTRTLELDWKMRALRVLPMFLLPGLSSLTYYALGSFTRMCDRNDQKNLERLRAERQERIDELKEKTNYYITQQLIQKYDTDPAAKAAAATVLASKLGADSGLKVYLGNESEFNVPTGRSNDVELVQSSGLRNRKQMLTRSNSTGSTIVQNLDEEMLHDTGNMGPEASAHNQLITEHYQPGSSTHDGGWFARIAAMLVGEDPTQCYALICGNCHMHNGLARKEDFPYVTYYCPHCNALNKSNNLEGTLGSELPSMSSSITTSDSNPIDPGTDPTGDSKSTSNSPMGASVEHREGASVESTEGSDAAVSGDPKPVS